MNNASARPGGDLGPLARLARRQGWTVHRTRKHWAWTSPQGTVVTTPGTPGRSRSHANTLALLRAAGLRTGR